MTLIRTYIFSVLDVHLVKRHLAHMILAECPILHFFDYTYTLRLLLSLVHWWRQRKDMRVSGKASGCVVFPVLAAIKPLKNVVHRTFDSGNSICSYRTLRTTTDVSIRIGPPKGNIAYRSDNNMMKFNVILCVPKWLERLAISFSWNVHFHFFHCR